MTHRIHSAENLQMPLRPRRLATWLAAWPVLLLTFADCGQCHAATPSFDGGLVIDDGGPEYTAGGAWEDGKNLGDYYR